MPDNLQILCGHDCKACLPAVYWPSDRQVTGLTDVLEQAKTLPLPQSQKRGKLTILPATATQSKTENSPVPAGQSQKVKNGA